MRILIYTTASCAACHTLTTWLDKLGFEYDKKILDDSPVILAEFMAINDGAIGVPFTVITLNDGTEHKISGFDQLKFRNTLEI